MVSNDSDDGRPGTVSRRRLLRSVGAGSVATAVAGCLSDPSSDGDGGNGSGNGSDNGSGGGVDIGSVSGSIEIAATSREAENKQGFVEALRSAGLSEDVSISFLATSDISGDIQSQYRQWLSAGRSKPDIFRMDSGWTIPFITRGQLTSLDGRLSEETLNNISDSYFSASVASATGTDGALYGVPYQIGLPTIQYRKDLVTDAGFDPEGENWATEPMSWERFSTVVSETKAQADVNYGYAWQGDNYVGLSCCTFNELMTSWGGAYFGGLENLFGPVGERPVTVTEQPVVDAIRMGRSFINGPDAENTLDGYEGISPENVLQWTEGPSRSAFVGGSAVALRYWPSAIPPAHEEFGDDLGVMPIPYGVEPSDAEYEDTGGTASALGGWHMVLNPNGDRTDAATAVLQAMTSQEFRQFQLEQLSLLPPDTAALEGDRISDIPVWGEYADTLKLAGENAVPRPVTSVWPDQTEAIAEQVNAALSGQKSPTAAMEDLQSTLEEIEESV
jgi:ABC-type glycerol-3-phosphate transport system substrate-binding protein